MKKQKEEADVENCLITDPEKEVERQATVCDLALGMIFCILIPICLVVFLWEREAARERKELAEWMVKAITHDCNIAPYVPSFYPPLDESLYNYY